MKADVVVRRKVQNLGLLELANIPLWLFVVTLLFPVSMTNLVGLGLFVLLLGQGGAYWLLKVRQLDRRLAVLPGIGCFATARVVNPIILALGTAFTIRGVIIAPGASTIPGLALALLAIMEQLNYFHIQLSHQNLPDLRRLRRSGLHPAHLARDLRRHERPRVSTQIAAG